MIVDTTVQPKNLTFPTDAKLPNRAREKLVRLAKLTGMSLRQSYARVGKFALIQHQRYAHAKQFKRAKRMLKRLRTYLGRVIRDIGRKIEGNATLEGRFAKLLMLAPRVREQQQRQRGPKVYSPHAPEVELHRQRQGPSALRVRRQGLGHHHAQARRGWSVRHPREVAARQSYDGHTLATVIPEMEALVCNTIERVFLDKGYRGPQCAAGLQVQDLPLRPEAGVTPKIKRQVRRRSAVEPVIGHLKAEHRMGRNYLWFKHGDANNAVLAAAGYNFRRLIRWLRLLLCPILAALFTEPIANPA